MLKFRLFKWFAGLVLIFGALAAFLGIWMIQERVVKEAQTRVRYNLSSAWAVYQSQMNSLETIVRLTAVRATLVEACAAQKWRPARPPGPTTAKSAEPPAAGGEADVQAFRDEIQGLLGNVRRDFDLDFLTLVSPEGQVVGRATPPFQTGDFRSAEPLIAKALAGAAAAGTVILAAEELSREADGLADRAFLPLQQTAHARPTPRSTEDRGMVMLAAAPVQKNGRVIGAIYAGIVLNRNRAFVDRIRNVAFGSEQYEGKPTGTVTVFLADTRIATTVLLENGNRAIGTRVSKEVADRVLDNSASWADRAFVVNDWYLTAYDPIHEGTSGQGPVIGMLYVGTLEKPFRDMGYSMIARYSVLVAVALVATLLVAMFMAGRIARPLHRLAESANNMRCGQGFAPVSPGRRDYDETAGLIRAFNEMAQTLSQREQKLSQANAQLAQVNSSLQATNANYMETLQFVSHELNSPLSAISNYAYLLRQRLLGPLAEKQENALDVMSVNLKRLLEMIRHYLNLARIESGEMQPVPTRVAVREEVIAPLLAGLEADIRANDLRVEDLVDPKLTLYSDLNMTREVFENLLSNAVKYGRAGGRITLGSRIAQEPGSSPWAEFAVRNEGDGIPPERRGELFQKFSRIELGDSKKMRRGTGLGLFICKKIVEAHGGTIAVDSLTGQWTEFRCTLPLADHGAKTRPAGPAG